MSFEYQNSKENTSTVSSRIPMSVSRPIQRKEDDEDELEYNEDYLGAVQRKANNTGIPDNIKQGYEQKYNLSFDDVRVHYNSSKPQELGALAYTQGSNVYMGAGQETHLNHELGHVVQQMQGRVSPTSSVNGMPLNDNAALEREADTML